MELISRKDAVTAGLRRYFTGKPCPNGHIVERYTGNKACQQCRREATYRRQRAPGNRSNETARKRKLAKSTRERRAIRNRKRHVSTIQRRIENILRSRLYLALKGQRSSVSAIRDLGCSLSEFKEYISSAFYSEMTWENWGKVWQLDHKIPIHQFDLTKEDELLRAVNWSNFQPLTIADHQAKTAAEVRRLRAVV